MYSPVTDGIDHINIYSKGKEMLGRFLSNFANYSMPIEGIQFASLEAYWYYLKTGDSSLAPYYGYIAKNRGRMRTEVLSPGTDKFQEKFKKAMAQKILGHKTFLPIFRASTLPFTHYYCYGDKVVDAGFSWVVDEWERLRSVAKGGVVEKNTSPRVVEKNTSPRVVEKKASPRRIVAACTGSRNIPHHMNTYLSSIGEFLSKKGCWIRTGGAQGSDSSFVEGANKVEPKKVILYLPWEDYRPQTFHKQNHLIFDGEKRKLLKEAQLYYKGNWNKASIGVQALMARNVAIMLGKDMNRKADLCLYYQSETSQSGGTQHGVDCAHKHSIPLFPISPSCSINKTLEKLENKLNSL